MSDVTAGATNISPGDRQAFQRRHGIIGRSTEIREVVDTIMQVAPTDITVLVTGESGTGKEVIAKAIHGASRRAARRFIPVNCGAIPEGILESELFGHEKGSFTGAVETRKGYFELADGGTIFLDEIGDTPISTQVKLLRVLESGEFMRVGSSEPRKSDVRIIAATNKSLDEEVRSKRFRQDLYFRLRSVNIRIPPLRNRRGDVPLLVESFLLSLAGEARKDILITDDGMAALMRHSWPGNVRELRNVIESIIILERGNVVDEHVVAKYLHLMEEPHDERSLPMHLGKAPEQAERELIFRLLWEIKTDIQELRGMVGELQHRPPLSLPPGDNDHGGTVNMDEMTLRGMEEELIAHMLHRFHGNRRLAAEALNISERTLYRKIKDYGL
ncbi:MAG: sigma-54-dependent Fis family transcriptional regulator [Bacteroidetes bacterium]|nr:sigma-54-dependent Fis family transcriptional regulator [Bacteroidota bacterium]